MSESMEIWKPIMGYEGLYEVSNLGRVRSLDRWVNNNGTNVLKRGTFKKSNKDKDGYLTVMLSSNRNNKRHRVHKLVAEAFIPNPDILPQVNHIDEDKTNNCVDNLEWCDAKYNMTYSHGKKILCIMNDKIIGYYPSIMEASKKLNIDPRQIGKCCENKRNYNTAGGYKWQYVEDYLADWWDKEMDKYMEKEKAA